MRIFISHSSKDSEVAAAVCSLLEKRHYSCFLAPRDIRSGYEYAEEIINGIDSSMVMLLLLSKESNNSPHVLREVERAVSKKIPIIVYKLEEVELTKSMEYFLMTHQWINADTSMGHKVIVKSIDEFVKRNSAESGKPRPDGDARNQPVKQEASASKQQAGGSNSKRSRGPVIAVAAGAAALAVVIILVLVIRSFLNSGNGHSETAVNDNKPTDTSAQMQESKAQETQSQETQAQESQIQETQVQETTQASDASDVKLGDTVVLGTYNGQPIRWRVLKLSDDGKQALVVSNDILTLKAYDAAESGRYNYYDGQDYWGSDIKTLTADMQTKLRGNNKWEYSNIRTWLNSANENVVYDDQAPGNKAMSDMKNGYDTEAGFLKNFTEEERAAVLTTEVDTNGTVTEDKVFLLSKDELSLLEAADVTRYPVPTQEAIAQDKSGWYKAYSVDCGVQDHFWWLRDADVTSYTNACECYLAGNSYSGGEIINKCVGLEGFGIRPAMTVDLTSPGIAVE